MWDIANYKDQNQSQSEDLYKEDREKLFKEIDEKREEIISLVDQYTDSDVSGDLKKLISNGFQVYVGGKVVNFEISSVEELPMDRLKEDVKQQFREKLEQIKESINEKLYSLSESYESLREKLDDEIRKSKETNDVVPMPDLHTSHAEQGLSVVKGANQDEIVWLYNGYYFVRTVDNYPISEKMRKKTLRPVTVKIVTNGDTVSSVKVKKFDNLNNFKHYHSMEGGSTDCWGDWHYHVNWESPEDIIEVGIHALEILTDVNTESPGSPEPHGLPKLDDLIRDSRGEGRNDYSEDNEETTDEDIMVAEPQQNNTLIWTTS